MCNREHYIATTKLYSSIPDSALKQTCIDGMIEIFADDNPDFDCHKFRLACQYKPKEETK